MLWLRLVVAQDEPDAGHEVEWWAWPNMYLLFFGVPVLPGFLLLA